MKLRAFQFLVLVVLILLWHVFTAPGLIPPFFFERDNQAAFFFGEPAKVFWVIVDWFVSFEIFSHLGYTLLETVLGFVIGYPTFRLRGYYFALAMLARRDGRFIRDGFFIMVFWYAVQRFCWEFFKPYRHVLGPLNLFQLICLGLLCYALFMLRHSRTRTG